MEEGVKSRGSWNVTMSRLSEILERVKCVAAWLGEVRVRPHSSGLSPGHAVSPIRVDAASWLGEGNRAWGEQPSEGKKQG